jgi:hypothetical protein
LFAVMKIRLPSTKLALCAPVKPLQIRGKAFCYDTERRDATALIKAGGLQNSTSRNTSNKTQRDVCKRYCGAVEEFCSCEM